MTIELLGVSIWLGDPSRWVLALGALCLLVVGIATWISEVRLARRRRIEQEMLERRLRYGGTVKH